MLVALTGPISLFRVATLLQSVCHSLSELDFHRNTEHVLALTSRIVSCQPAPMDSEDMRDAPRMTVDESPVASTSTSSADATAPDSISEQATTKQDSKDENTLSEATADPSAASSSIASTSQATSQPGSSASSAIPAAKSEPEIRVWKPVAPGTMPKPRMLFSWTYLLR